MRISSWCLLSLHICYMDNHIIYKNCYSFSFPVRIIFISFSCLIALSNTLSTMLKKNAKGEYLCLLPVLIGKLLIFIFKFDINWRFAMNVLYQFEEVPLFLFCKEILSWICVLLNDSSVSVVIIMWLFSSLTCWYDGLYWSIFKFRNNLASLDKSYLSMLYNSFHIFLDFIF